MRLIHADLYDARFEQVKDTCVAIENEKITAIAQDMLSVPAEEETVDLSGLTLYPGFIDMHIHGAVNEDVSDASVTGLERIAGFLASKGVTGFCPTTMMIPKEKLTHVLMSAEVFANKENEGARMLGVRMEGPFLSPEKCGVQKVENAALPSVQYVDGVMRGISSSLLRVVDVSPELPGFFEFASEMKDRVVLSIAHTAATYDCCRKAIAAGVHHATHLFNAMSPLHHREPGPVGAVLEDPNVTAELICDGLHVHPAVLKVTFQVLGEDRAVVVSDAMRAAGMPDGEYDLGGTKVTVVNGKTDFGKGRLAGSTTNVHDEFVHLLSLGIPVRKALKACTINPARVLGIEQETGSIAVGKYADLVAMDSEYNVRKVWSRGKLIYDAETSALTEEKKETQA